MRRRRSTSGFTLVELMVALMLTALVAVIVGVIYLTNQRSWKQGQEKLILQQEVTRCVEQIARDVRASRWVQYAGPTDLRTYDATGSETHHYYLSGDKLYQDAGPLVDLKCTQLTFGINSDTTIVSVVVELEDAAENKVKVETDAALRNRNYTNL